MTLPSGEREERIQEPQTTPDLSHLRPMDAPAAYRVDFYFIYLAVGVAGFTMSWTAPSRAPGDSASAGVASPVTHTMNGQARLEAGLTPVMDDNRYSGSNLWLVPEFSTTVTSSTATQAIQWGE